ncbi:uncharacterized protein LOC122033519 isoform X2 [Zingiber officinale]|uniref:uncharacterized protein LOC122033519 isoform X2 n=1 Tax=Zingiber officinale TaxID=94328 RepID=UPI001C4B51F0|nr:uncharacterized protein LOC122033519 isoform X2 [Zingiber officinale]
MLILEGQVRMYVIDTGLEKILFHLRIMDTLAHLTDSMCRLLSTRTSVSLYGMLVVRIRYIQSTYAIFGEGLYEGLDWLSNNIASKVFGVEGLHLADSAPDGFLFDVE